MKWIIFTVSVFVALLSDAWSEVRPNRLFTDNAVLQQNEEVPVWGTAKEGEKVTVLFDGQMAETSAKDGKWMVKLQPHKAGGPYSLIIKGENSVTANNVLVGEVWVCSGQSNMAFNFGEAANAKQEGPLANYPKFRMFTVSKRTALQPISELEGKWIECSPATVSGFSAVGYFFGRDIHKSTKAPVGMIHSSWAGTPAQSWTSLSGLEREPALQGYVDITRKLLANYDMARAMYPQQLAEYEAKLKEWKQGAGVAFETAVKSWAAENEKNKAEGKPLLPKPTPAVPAPRAPASPDGAPWSPTTLYNGMIAPLLPYAIKGVIWYQGESNSGNPKEYRLLFPRLIADWREKWGRGDFPFLFVQVAPYQKQSPELREAQFLTWKKTPQTAMVVTTDAGDPVNIHPTNKEPVGVRLALAARSLAYGEKVEYSGPEFAMLKIDQNRAILTFRHTGSGLISKGGDLEGFTICGADQKFIKGKARISGNAVIVWSEQVGTPVAVRYGWGGVPEGNLYNMEGLPASPFRTDEPSPN